MIIGPQCRAARALVQFSRDRLAQLSGIDSEAIEHHSETKRIADLENEGGIIGYDSLS
ncbi:hypothetical protein KUG47_10720 [Falsochrobactrum sp. TDYN1]|uniref:Uncharacterized protein n=1 Tax=Falsochrobactrum tianjinense TaxID=2706015 RepID=A0A949PQ58_9HYPH|nr:hypothetical protein [Falsochrobactrum sp. TDYN1]MBV2143966.1 hypothetical protein [Falsochrobactrum sp. TDYN1]